MATSTESTEAFAVNFTIPGASSWLTPQPASYCERLEATQKITHWEWGHRMEEDITSRLASAPAAILWRRHSRGMT